MSSLHFSLLYAGWYYRQVPLCLDPFFFFFSFFFFKPCESRSLAYFLFVSLGLATLHLIAPSGTPLRIQGPCPARMGEREGSCSLTARPAVERAELWDKDSVSPRSGHPGG
jgi:hypothetical protein